MQPHDSPREHSVKGFFSGPPESCEDILVAGVPQILNFYSLRGHDKWVNVGFEACFLPVFFVGALLALSYIRHQKR